MTLIEGLYSQVRWEWLTMKNGLLYFNKLNIRMETESTTKSVTLDMQAHYPSTQGKHLINTTKVLRGHKLRTQDFIKLQLMRFRYCSPVKYQDQIQQNMTQFGKSTEFADKYRGFQYENDEKELYRMIEYQREKESRQTAKRIKMLNPHQNQPAIKPSKLTFNNTQLSMKPKPATHQQRRTTSNWKKMNKTISFNTPQTVPNPNKNKLEFTSQNLGNKMNEYMNQMIDPLVLAEAHSHQISQVQNNFPFRQSEIQRFEKALPKEKQTNSHLKQMKKRFRSKYSAVIQTSKQIREHYTQYNLQPFNENADHSITTMMNICEQPIFHSIQLKNVVEDSPGYKGRQYHPPKTAGKIQQYHQMSNSAKISK